jgi:non-ribosomal peptide synthetase-like protein
MSTLMPDPPTQLPPVSLAERDDIRRSIPMSELVLVDRYEAQGWRVRTDERLDRLFEARCDWVRTYGRSGQPAIDSAELSLTYDELDARANQLARFLRLRGANPGDRIGLLFDRPADAYVAILAVLKIGAAYVPMDVNGPASRTAAIVEDARVRTVLSTSWVADRVTQVGAEIVPLDLAARLIGEQSPHRLLDAERGIRDGSLAYITYRPGPDGRPAGVAVDHRSICNFVKVAAEMYGIRPWDRVYQGVSIADGFSAEEIWVPWAVGATLVPGPTGRSMPGQELHAFLSARRVTTLRSVPGVLATLERDLPDLRLLLVAGPGCPQELVRRWHKPERRLLGVYGPAGATVSATWTELHPLKPATIGIPLPTYSTVILDVDDPFHALPHGQVGEIGVVGIGLNCGYLNRDDLTEKAFIPDFLGIPGNPSGRIFRTGDLGRVNPDGEIEYRGRLDGQEVTPRAVEPQTVELPVVPVVQPSMPQAVPVPPPVELPVPQAMPVPQAIELPVPQAVGLPVPQAVQLPVPQAVPVPQALPVSHAGAPAEAPVVEPVPAVAPAKAPATTAAPAAGIADAGLATALAAVLAEVIGAPQVPADAHFFDDLGADSMVMARFCARLRKRDDLPAVAMKDVYANPTIALLAQAFGSSSTAVGAAESSDPPMFNTSIMRAVRAVRAVRAARHRHTPTRTPRYVLCGALQLLFLIGYPSLTAVVGVKGYEWVSAGEGLIDVYLRSVAFGSAVFLGLCALPILLKWVLVGRWKPQEIPVWSMAYFRFWLVKSLIQRNPMALFVGSPLYALYLRALGAKIGRGAVILSENVPVCTDMLRIGDGAVIRKDSFFTGYRAHNGIVQTGPVSLGNGALVGEVTVLDIWTSLGDGAQLGHSSSLHAGQTVPDGERWHGSPAQPTDVDYQRIPAASHVSTGRRVVFATVQLVNLLLLGSPLVFSVVIPALSEVPQLAAVLAAGPVQFTSWTFYLDALVLSGALFFGAVIVGLVFMGTVPRLLNLAITPDKVYPLYGFHYWVQRAIARTTNRKFYTRLFGDSSYIVHYLRWLGYDLRGVQQTGSNFGEDVKHDTPFLSAVGSGTVVADGLSIINADFSTTSFRLSRVSIGAHNFLGNRIAYPAQGRTGDNCLLATKLMVPVDGQVREGVGLLGAPSFDIPRSVERDKQLDVGNADELRRGLRAKNVHNTITMALFLLVRWMFFFVVTVLYLGALDAHASMGAFALVVANVAVFFFTVAYWVSVDQLFRPLQALRPQGCSIYDRAFWRHERFWKISADTYLNAFNGTPLKNVIWRMLGVRIGRRVFDDGCFLTERTFTTIGDGSTLNAGSVIQCHSQEDGGFKSDHSVIGTGCTLGVGAFVHYGVTMGDGAVLAADSFLMKGEEMPANAQWGGNPAKKMREHSADLQVRRITIDNNYAAELVRV